MSLSLSIHTRREFILVCLKFSINFYMVNCRQCRRLFEFHKRIDCNFQVDMLVAEVEALKVIVKSPISSSSQVTHLTTVTPQRTSLASRFLGSTRKCIRLLHIFLHSSNIYSFFLFFSFGFVALL